MTLYSGHFNWYDSVKFPRGSKITMEVWEDVTCIVTLAKNIVTIKIFFMQVKNPVWGKNQVVVTN